MLFLGLYFLIDIHQMCTNYKTIYNRYIRRTVTVSCGKCPSCLQAKACARANRIRNTNKDGFICLFVTLTYKNDFVPYVRFDDIQQRVNPLPVYRDYDGRFVRSSSSDYSQVFVSEESSGPVVCYDIDWLRFSNKDLRFKFLNGKPYCVGVLLYKDIQDFRKRLNYYLFSHGYKSEYKCFFCSEYGGTSLRPHFHCLMFVPASLETVFRCAIVAAWPFADSARTSQFIEVARNAASYVSSYVNCGSDVSPLLQVSYFRQKHSYSKGFGMALDSFSLPSVLEKARSGNLLYTSTTVRDGVSVTCDYPIPKYVINRYFPYFKGFSRVAPDKMVFLLQYPFIFLRYVYLDELDYSDDDLHKVLVRLRNAFRYYHSVTGGTAFDFAIDYTMVWRVYASQSLKLSYDCVEHVSDWSRFYSNVAEYIAPRFARAELGLVMSGTMVSSISLDEISENIPVLCVNPNKLVGQYEKSVNLEKLYYKMVKQKRVTNMVMADFLNLDV